MDEKEFASGERVDENTRDLYFARRYEEALAAAQKLIARDPDLTWAYCVWASSLAQMGRASEGLAVAEQAIGLEPCFPLALTTRALCLHRLGRDVEAEADFERALAAATDNFRVHYNYACYWAEKNEERRCRESFARAVELMSAEDAGNIPLDPDLARYHGREWFRELLAEAKMKKG